MIDKLKNLIVYLLSALNFTWIIILRRKAEVCNLNRVQTIFIYSDLICIVLKPKDQKGKVLKMKIP